MHSVKKFEYQTKILDAKGILGGKINVMEFNQTLNDMGREGWELVGTTASNQEFGSTRYIICVFKRELA